jgi:hypothetical protein
MSRVKVYLMAGLMLGGFSLSAPSPATAQTCEDNCYSSYNTCTNYCQCVNPPYESSSSSSDFRQPIDDPCSDPYCHDNCYAQLNSCLSGCPSTPSVRTGMTWTVLGQQNGYVHVGADGQTNAYAGDTTIDQFLPILCVLVDGRPAPGGIAFDSYNGWARGAVQVTPPIAATVLTSQQQGDEICADTFGAGWRLAEFHDGRYGSDFSAAGGWTFWAAGQLAPGTRFWTAINDQPANPWNSAGSVPAVTPPKFFPADQPVPNQYLAMLPESTPEADVQSLANSLVATYGGTILDVFPAAQGFSFTGNDTQAQAMSQDYRVESVAQDSYGQPDQAAPWHLDRIDQRFLPLNNAYAPFNGGAANTVNIYILDTGFRRSHFEIIGRARQDADFTRHPGDDCHGHGTAVAGVASGTSVGVSNGANLISLRIAECQGSTSSGTIIAGVDWLARNHIKPAVANISYGGPISFLQRWLHIPTALDRAVNRAVRAGVTVVVAAGNNNPAGQNADRTSPARAAGAITVSATDTSDTRAGFANYGKVDLFAPGVNIRTASFNGDNFYTIQSGTSLAAPIVAGAVAMYLRDHPFASPAEVRNALQSNATPNVVNNPGPGSANLLVYVGPGTWTSWLDRDDPSGTGDWEMISDFRAAGNNICNGATPIGIQCRTLSGVDWTSTGQTYTCDRTIGGVCQNNGQNCLDYQVRFLCP